LLDADRQPSRPRLQVCAQGKLGTARSNQTFVRYITVRLVHRQCLTGARPRKRLAGSALGPGAEGFLSGPTEPGEPSCAARSSLLGYAGRRPDERGMPRHVAVAACSAHDLPDSSCNFIRWRACTSSECAAPRRFTASHSMIRTVGIDDIISILVSTAA